MSFVGFKHVMLKLQIEVRDQLDCLFIFKRFFEKNVTGIFVDFILMKESKKPEK